MSQISLLPSEYKSYAVRKKKKSLLSIISIVTVAVLIMSYIMLSLLNLVYSGELDSLGVEKNQLEVMIKTYGKYSDVYNSVKKYEQLTDTAKIDDLNWDIVLNEFAETIPHGMWFDSINLDYDGKEASCVITGRLTEKIIIAQWLTDIEKTGILKNVVCEYLQNIEKSDQIIVSYEINADIDINKIKSDKGME